MALGIEPNSIAPNLIMQSGKMLSDNIRDIGKQVQSSIFEINTKKDLAAMAQEIQQGAVIPQSETFAEDAVAFGFRHPLAIQDPRGQMALNVLGKAHSEWRQGQLAQQRINPYRSMAGGGIYNAKTGEIEVEPTAAPKSVNRNARLVNPETGEVIVEPEALQPKVTHLSPGGKLVDSSGKIIADNPKTAAPLNDAQRESIAIRRNAARRAAIKVQVDSVERDIRALEQSVRSPKTPLPGEVEQWDKEILKLRGQRNKLLEQFNAPPTAEELTIEPELGAVPPGAAAPQGDGGILPEPGAIVAPLPDGNELVAVINPQGKPTRIKKSQLESALQNGYRTR